MIVRYYAVKDLAQNAFGNLMLMPSHGVAIRSFSDEVNRKAEENQMYQHPGDFELWFIGEFNNETGHMETERGERLARAADHAKHYED